MPDTAQPSNIDLRASFASERGIAVSDSKGQIVDPEIYFDFLSPDDDGDWDDDQSEQCENCNGYLICDECLDWEIGE